MAFFERALFRAGPIMLVVISAQAAPDVNRFQGRWESCQTTKFGRECDYMELLAGQNRVCGTWHYSATSRYYDGRLIGMSSQHGIKVAHICGRAGSDANTECADDLSWEAPSADRHILLCNGKLYPHGEYFQNSCGNVARRDEHLGYIGKPIASRRLSELTGMYWMRRCLHAPLYPPPK